MLVVFGVIVYIIVYNFVLLISNYIIENFIYNVVCTILWVIIVTTLNLP